MRTPQGSLSDPSNMIPKTKLNEHWLPFKQRWDPAPKKETQLVVLVGFP